MTSTTDRVFSALADPTRRKLVEWLDNGAATTATESARRLPISRQAVTKHLKELEAAGLLTVNRSGREAHYALAPSGLAEVSAWIEDREAAWNERLDRLARNAERNPPGGGTFPN